MKYKLQVYEKANKADGIRRKTSGLVSTTSNRQTAVNICSLEKKVKWVSPLVMATTASTERMELPKDIPKRSFINTNLISLKCLLFFFFGGTGSTCLYNFLFNITRDRNDLSSQKWSSSFIFTSEQFYYHLSPMYFH